MLQRPQQPGIAATLPLVRTPWATIGGHRAR